MFTSHPSYYSSSAKALCALPETISTVDNKFSTDTSLYQIAKLSEEALKYRSLFPHTRKIFSIHSLELFR